METRRATIIFLVLCVLCFYGWHHILKGEFIYLKSHVPVRLLYCTVSLIFENAENGFSSIVNSYLYVAFQFLVLDEADRVLDVGFEEELRAIFQCLPKNRQTLLFSATMTSNLQTLLELSANKAYFYEAYEGFKTVESLKQQYIFIPKNVKDVYLQYILSKIKDIDVRSAIIFVSPCR